MHIPLLAQQPPRRNFHRLSIVPSLLHPVAQSFPWCPSYPVRAARLRRHLLDECGGQAKNHPRYVMPPAHMTQRLIGGPLSQNIADDRKYQCDFCPVQMARLHDINRHMRIHSEFSNTVPLSGQLNLEFAAGVHPYACIGCGETFRRTDARTRHWCKQPECFKIHSAKAPTSKVRQPTKVWQPL
jgi:NAD-dependent dihydropyrimidine dehydrogenase PreA subunit